MGSTSDQRRSSHSDRREEIGPGLWIGAFLCCVPFMWSWIYTAVRPSRGWLDFRELEIMVIVVGGVLFTSCLLATALSCRRRSWRIFALPAAALTVCTFVLVALVEQVGSLGWYDEVVGAFCILCVGISYASLLLIPLLPTRIARLQRVTVTVTLISTFYLASVVLFDVFEEPPVFYIGVSLCTITTCGSLALALFVLVREFRRRAFDGEDSGRMSLSCPGCGFTDVVDVGKVECTSCGLKLLIEVEAGTGR